MAEYQDPFSGLAKGIQSGMQIGMERQKLLAQQKEAKLQELKGMYDKAKGQVSLGLEFLKSAKSREGMQNVLNKMIAPNMSIVAPGVPIGEFSLADDATADAISAYSDGIKKYGTQWGQEQYPTLIQLIAEDSPDFGKAVKSAQEAVLPQLPSGAVFEAQGEGGKPVLGQTTGFGEFSPLRQGGQDIQKPPTPLAGEAAGKVSTAQEVVAVVDKAIENLFNDNKELDRFQVMTGKLKIPFTKGKGMFKELELAVNNKVRIDSGAAIKQEEVDDLMNLMVPGLLDSDEFAYDQLQRFRNITANYLFLQDPVGKLQLVPKSGDSEGIIKTNIKPTKSSEIKTADDYLKSINGD